jgi:SAM-dependent methyltransferase
MTDPNFPIDDEVRARHEANRANWNASAEAYTQTLQATVEFILEGKSNLATVERANLGDLRSWCQHAIHLQCASGKDTLSLLNEGVNRVTGVDISDVHIENARKTCAALAARGHPVQAEWVRCDVLDTPHTLDGSADLVYTGRGAMCWLHDLNAHARVVARLLKPGGVYHVYDDHPMTILFDLDQESYVFREASYFGHWEKDAGWPCHTVDQMLGGTKKQPPARFEKGWTLMEIINVLIDAGLTIEYLGEHPEAEWNIFPNLKPELRGIIPLMFSLRARK